MEHNTTNIVNMVDVALHNLLHSDTIKEIEFSISKEAFFKEFRLLTFYLPRRSGATTAAIYLAENYKKSLVILPTNKSILDHVRSIYPTIDAMSYKDITPAWFRGRSALDLIIIDSSKLISAVDINRTIDNLKDYTKLFVVLG